jgi:hypothetical protein
VASEALGSWDERGTTLLIEASGELATGRLAA